MDFDFEPYFKRYQAIAALADEAFERVRKGYSECMTCRLGCSDCCHALFDLTFIEAIYLNRKFYEVISKQSRQDLFNKANRADRTIHKIKRQAQKSVKQGKSDEEVLLALGEERVRCPLLNHDNQCDLYEHRPIICRLYGIPLNIGGTARICSLTKFRDGVQYPTVNVEAIQQRLYNLSAELVRDLNSKFPGLVDLLVPVSMALLTDYDEEYLGLDISQENQAENLSTGSVDKGNDSNG
jgi:Fe-S-cluster containining protein